jgi:hypothetical protein
MVLFVNCGDNIKVYFSIVTHEIPLRARKKTNKRKSERSFYIYQTDAAKN